LTFDLTDQQRLLVLARQCLVARVRRDRAPAPDVTAPLDLACGAFVSIHHGRALRGCLGRVTCDWAVGRVVAHLAEAVADSDPRFAPVTVAELDELHIEVSVLTPEREADAADIEVGRHGLIVERGRSRGLLLPQVAVEHGWDAVTFLRYTCMKAGLPPDAWQGDARLFVFEAQVFGERTASTHETRSAGTPVERSSGSAGTPLRPSSSMRAGGRG
jgi:AmmeMemoRadiSam system protein A